MVFFFYDRGVGAETPDLRRSLVTCCFTTPRRRQPFLRNEAVAAQLCKLWLSPLVTALSARAAVVQALEELALPSVLPLGEIGVEGVIRRGTTCFAVQTTPLRLRSPDFRQEDANDQGGNNPVCRAAVQSFVAWRY